MIVIMYLVCYLLLDFFFLEEVVRLDIVGDRIGFFYWYFF